MPTFNWDELEEKAGGNFSPYAEVGTHTAKVDTVDIRETKNAQGNTTYWLDIMFVDEGTKFPKISHPISFKNDAWRRVHFMRILKELGIPEEKAKQAIEQAEGKKSNDDIVAAYFSVFDRATAKHPSVEVDVFEDDNLNPNTGRPYMRADFKNPQIAFGRGGKKEAPKGETILDQGEDINDSSLDLPF